MGRKLAVLGLSFALASLAAAWMPPLGILLAAALCVVAVMIARRSQLLWPVAGITAGLVWFVIFSAFLIEPAQKLAGQTYECTAVAQTDCVYNYTGDHLHGTILVEQLDGRPVRIRAYCGDIPVHEVGERFHAELTFADLAEDSYRLTNMARGTFVQVQAVNGESLGRSRSPAIWFYDLRIALSQRLRFWMPKVLGGVASAMLLGDRSGLDQQELIAFRNAGVSHLLAVSGLHVGLLCGLLAGRRRRFYRPVILMQAAALVGYMFLTGCSVPVRRAGLVYLISLLGNFVLLPFDMLTATGAVAVLLCLFNPYAPCDLSFQLSFCAILGVHVATLIMARITARLYGQTEESIPFQGLISGVLVSVFAALFTLPVLLAYGLTISGAGALCNMLVVWMLAPALWLGLIVLVLSPLPFAHHAASLCLAVWLKWMLGIVHWCTELPFAHLELPRRYTLGVLALLCITALLLYWCGRMKWFVPTAAMLTAGALALGNCLYSGEVRVDLVGRAGNPCAVITQNRQAAVIFRGGADNWNDVKYTLQQRGDPELTLVVDLREQPKELDIPDTAALLVLEEQPAYGTASLLTDLSLEWYNTGNANLLLLSADGETIGFMAGSIRLKTPVSVDVFCAAGAVSDSVQTKMIVTTSQKSSWLETVGDTPVFYGTDPVLFMQKGRSIRYEEMTRLAVQ